LQFAATEKAKARAKDYWIMGWQSLTDSWQLAVLKDSWQNISWQFAVTAKDKR